MKIHIVPVLFLIAGVLGSHSSAAYLDPRDEAQSKLSAEGITRSQYGERLVEACRSKDIRRVNLLLEAGASPNARVERMAPSGGPGDRSVPSNCKEERTPLLEAVAVDHAEMIKLLIMAGASCNQGARVWSEHGNVNEVSESNWTPLHEAAKKGKTRAAKVLLEAGADPNARSVWDVDQFTYILTIRAHERETTQEARSAGNSPLHTAVDAGNFEMARLLIDAGADVNARDQTGMTPLHLAAAGNLPVIARLLIVRGAQVDADSISWGTPLLIAEQNGKEVDTRGRRNQVG